VSGAITAVLLGVPGVLLIARAGASSMMGFAPPQQTATRTVTVPGQVTGVTVDSYGAPVSVQAGDVSRVQVIETITWNGPGTPAGVPAVSQTVSRGQLTLASPDCAAAGVLPLSVPIAITDSGPFKVPVPKGRWLKSGPSRPSAPSAGSAGSVGSASSASDCEVAFDVTTPKGVRATVSSAGGPISVSGTAGANLDSGGGFVTAEQVAGPLTVRSDGGFIRVDGLTGTLNADSGSGPVIAQDLTAPAATVTTEGGSATLDYAIAPESVTVSTGGGPADVDVPGGPYAYALTADSGGGPEMFGIPVAATASRSITVSTDGGMLIVGSPGTPGAKG
jgi:hypothetical protein